MVELVQLSFCLPLEEISAALNQQTQVTVNILYYNSHYKYNKCYLVREWRRIISVFLYLLRKMCDMTVVVHSFVLTS